MLGISTLFEQFGAGMPRLVVFIDISTQDFHQENVLDKAINGEI